MGYNRKSIQPKDLELEGICKTLKKARIVMPLLSVT